MRVKDNDVKKVLHRIMGESALIQKSKQGRYIIWRAGNHSFHVRGKRPARNSPRYSYDFRETTLEIAEFEVWICGIDGTRNYYLIPMTEIRRLYETPGSWPNPIYSKTNTVNVNAETHSVKFARDREPLDLTRYFCATLGT
jgi:hypothetical protein